jgi:hypothetical protein
MGIDARFFAYWDKAPASQTIDNVDALFARFGYSTPARIAVPEGFAIQSNFGNDRFFGPGYERESNFPVHVLIMDILSAAGARVFYGPDTESQVPEFVARTLNQTGRYFLRHGTRNYTNPAYQTPMSVPDYGPGVVNFITGEIVG